MIQEMHSQQVHVRKDDKGKQDEILATIPQEGGETALEVAMTHNSLNDVSVELRYLVWGKGLGWYRQHTLRFNGTAARDLIRALGIVQRRVEAQLVESLGCKVLPFPHPRVPQHPAATA
jgi:hypothetical protein